MKAEQYEVYLSTWLSKCQNYPSQVILKQAIELMKEQDKRLALAQQQLDAQAWSPKNWS